MTTLEYVTEKETAKLIEASSWGRYLAIIYGPGWVAVNIDASPWAAKVLKEIRMLDMGSHYQATPNPK